MHLDQYKTFAEYPRCPEADNPKALWRLNDPKDGIGFFTFIQKRELPNASGNCDTPNALKVQVDSVHPPYCYSYKYLTALCVVMEFKENFLTSQAAWTYRGGCFENGEVALYKPAPVGKSQSLEV